MTSGTLDGKVVLVTGAGSGIGRATAEAAADQGARVGLLGLTPEALGETAESIGDGALVLPADISNDDQIRGACARLAREFGTIDAVFANAGINGASRHRRGAYIRASSPSQPALAAGATT